METRTSPRCTGVADPMPEADVPHCSLVEPQTARLRLRQWRRSDREPFAALNADREVMRYFPALLTREQSDAMADRCEILIAERGWGLWAVESIEDGRFIGCVGLHTPSPLLPFSPCVEIAWRLIRDAWGQGYASEAAGAALAVGFGTLQLDEIVAFTTLGNQRSRAVMARLGMRYDGEFEHPQVAEGSSLRPHALYRLSARQRL